MNYQPTCKATIKLIQDVGQYIRAERQQFTPDLVETKSLNSLVSKVDKNAELKLVSGLTEILPEAGFIAEEGTSTKIGDTYNWVIDPLDGTTNFIHGIPVFSISVALIKNGFPVLGVVYEINQSECFYAFDGAIGAFLNGKSISVSSNTKFSNSLIATGFPYYNFEKMDGFLASLQHFMKNTRGVRRMGSAAVDLAYVACGRFDAFYETNLHPWDVAAGAYIVEKAGGKSGFFTEKETFTDGSQILATNGLLHPEMQELLAKFYQ